MTDSSCVVVLSAVRTPIGSFRGALRQKTAPELGAIVIRHALKAAALSPEHVGEVYMGQALQAGCRQAPARQAALMASLPCTVDCTTINKACASSLKAVTLAAQSILLGNHAFVVAGGMESMSNAPFLVPRDIPTYGGQMMQDTITHDGLTCAFNGIHMGACTERLVQRMGISRQDQDRYAVESYEKAAHAWKRGAFTAEVVPVSITDLKSRATIEVTEDEEYTKLLPSKVASLRPAFTADGTITAANASKLNDGACALVLAHEDHARRLGLTPLARVIAFADAACEPADFGIAPAAAITKALERASLQIPQVDLFEINEAFSAVPLVCIKELGLDPLKVNTDGGAVSLGHPVGASGGRILAHLVWSLQPCQIGVAAICNGGGGATAVVVRKLATA